MKIFQNIFCIGVAYFYILLFFYASISKVLDFENFQIQIGQSPLLSALTGIISYSVIIIEIVVAIFLSFRQTRLFALYISLFLMSAFTAYIIIILNYSPFIPCSCGGVLEKMTWTEHLIFNVIAMIMAIIYIVIEEIRKGTLLKFYSRSIILVLVLSCGLVVALYFKSDYTSKVVNNFIRVFFPNALIESNRMTLDHEYYYFAGYNEGKIYLGDVTSPLRPQIITEDLSSKSTFVIKPDELNFQFRNLKLLIHAPHYYLYDGSVPIIYRGNLNNSRATTVSYKDAYFNQIAVIDSTQFAIRTLNSTTRAFSLGKILLTNEKPIIELFPNILKKQIDGVFDSDGMLLSNPINGDVVYTYSYRNQIISMNQKMEVLKSQNTIDTTNIAQVKTKKLADGSFKMSAPPFKVNKTQIIFGNYLLNDSNLMGKYENAKKWETSSIIDIYNLHSHQYLGSFYVPASKKKKMNQMLLTENRLYVLVGKEIIAYELRDTVFQLIKKGNAENLTE